MLEEVLAKWCRITKRDLDVEIMVVELMKAHLWQQERQQEKEPVYYYECGKFKSAR